MRKSGIYQYYVEGEDERSLLNTLKLRCIESGKIDKFNVIQSRFTTARMRTLKTGTTVVLVYDTDVEMNTKILDENIYSIQSAPVKGHIKRGKYVSAHLHLDVLYIMEADDKIPLVYREDESKGVKWIPFEEADNDTMCDFIRPVNKKLIKKLGSK